MLIRPEDAGDSPVVGRSSSRDDAFEFLALTPTLTMRARLRTPADNESQLVDSVAPIEKSQR